jgi:ribosome recycling factor
MTDSRLDDFARRMDGALEALRKEFAGLRTGRASVNLLDQIHVDAYGGSMHLAQVATVSVPEPRLITVQVWDKQLVKAVDKAIRDSGLGLNPQQDGPLIRVPIPELTAERRQELAKVAGRYAEQARVAIRNIRRDAMELLKRMQKDGEISEDEHEKLTADAQRLTDQHTKKVDETLAGKEREIKQI